MARRNSHAQIRYGPSASLSRTLMVVVFVWLAFPVGARELKPATLAAFERYVKLTEARMAPEVDGASPFLWVDRQAEPRRSQLNAQLKRGVVLAERLQTREGNAEIDISDGMIHHWVGTILLPGATIEKVMAFVKDYGNYSKYFAPTIVRSRVISQTSDHFEVAMRTSTRKVSVTVTIDADYVIDYRILGEDRVYTRSVARNFFEVADAGTPHERRTPAEQGRGYLWRLNNYCSFQQRPEGVYEQCESISLTTDIPWYLKWIVTPFVTGVPRETLEFTLGQVRAGVK
ncbi:MAG TPA: hypothetical protein VES67_16040 [Vicinamibacterales bacterium]|nr:hypothetical protein [Vicinamibacterales bacterium]